MGFSVKVSPGNLTDYNSPAEAAQEMIDVDERLDCPQVDGSLK
jgi:hypothetical protein